MATDHGRFWMTEEWSFAILRALTMVGGMIALFLVPLRPEHQVHLAPLAWVFVAYKALLFLAIRAWPARLRLILLATTGLDLVFVSLFVWHTGGGESHFYLLFYLLVALAAAYFGPGIGFMAAGAGTLLYLLTSLGGPSGDWHHVNPRVITLFLLAGSLGYLSQRERLARAEAERLNEELAENQARLVQSERLATIGQMSAKVSHEVRNPLSSISLNVELLEDELHGLPEDRRAEAANLVAAIRSQVDVLSAVTEEYLRFARLPKPKLEVAAVAPVIEELVDFVREELRARKVELVVDVPAAQPTLRLDPGQIRQALLNLIRNAAEAMPKGGTVTITSRLVYGSNSQVVNSSRPIDQATARPIDKGDFIEIAVRDTGTGIPAENLDRIFEPFFTTKDGGTGLGLAIARQIVADHGGSLTCESTPGVGTTFYMTLPVPDGERRR